MAVWPVLVLLAVIAGCGPRSTPAFPSSPAPAPRIVVLSFRAGGGLAADGRFEPSGSTLPEEAEVGADFGRILAAALARRGFDVVEIGATEAPVADPAEADALARSHGAALVVYGAVSRYRQRVGSDWGIEDPASVAYDAALVRAADAALLRVEHFDYTQAPLTANLLQLPRFVAGGGRWLTREKIRDDALDDTADRLAKVAREAPLRE